MPLCQRGLGLGAIALGMARQGERATSVGRLALAAGFWHFLAAIGAVPIQAS